MAGWTNKGKAFALESIFRATALPTNYFIALVRVTAVPDADTNTMAELTQISTGTGYTDGGISLNLDATDFDVLDEDDAADAGLIQLKDIIWTAAGGNLDSGAGARFAVLTDDNATVSLREVLHFWDLVSDRNVSDTQELTLQDCEIRINES